MLPVFTKVCGGVPHRITILSLLLSLSKLECVSCRFCGPRDGRLSTFPGILKLQTILDCRNRQTQNVPPSMSMDFDMTARYSGDGPSPAMYQHFSIFPGGQKRRHGYIVLEGTSVRSLCKLCQALLRHDGALLASLPLSSALFSLSVFVIAHETWAYYNRIETMPTLYPGLNLLLWQTSFTVLPVPQVYYYTQLVGTLVPLIWMLQDIIFSAIFSVHSVQ
ncbi:hypothetical protein J3R30DRAFT_2193069 [Lentinula aciculospora]|uniref:Uncharacterized protein n=1 Tax=Lentinula aciculospora TaxID=153920 RepID=A0A9W9AGY2_9AGAR|nr:hypothetical protein J3R30DRAFT_2193069 [Lentinula aciculospora]